MICPSYHRFKSKGKEDNIYHWKQPKEATEAGYIPNDSTIMRRRSSFSSSRVLLVWLPLVIFTLNTSIWKTRAAQVGVPVDGGKPGSLFSVKTRKGGEAVQQQQQQQQQQTLPGHDPQLEQKARRRAMLFARSGKSDADTEELVSGFNEQEQGAVWFELGKIYTDGLGSEGNAKSVERDLPRGLKCIIRAARDHGYPHAQHRLSVAYATGLLGPIGPVPGDKARSSDEGGPSDEVRAMVLEQFAAMTGNVPASMGLGYRYLYGYGTPTNCDKALIYYEIAANAAVEEMDRLKVLPPNERTRLLIQGGAAAILKRRPQDADQQLVDYYMHTADKGDVGAQMALGKLCFHGSQGVKQDFGKAAKYFEMAAKGGDAMAAGSIGHMYAVGIGVAQNNETARRYFLQGEEGGDAASLNGLGYLYMHGMGVEKNIEKAVKLFQKAAHEKGHSEAFFNLGLVYSGVIPGVDDGSTSVAAAAIDAKTRPKAQAVAAAAKSAMAKVEAIDGAAASGKELPADVQDSLQDLSRKARELEKIVQDEVKQIIADVRAEQEEEAKTKGAKAGGKGKKEQAADEPIKVNLQKALKYFSLAAQAGHMGALHKIGQMYSQGISTARSCTTAVHAFKGVAERGPWVANLSKAFTKYKAGDFLGALLLYVQMAEIGYETAQSNAALLLEERNCGELSPIDCQRLAVRLYRHASKQGNAESSLKVGDAYYYGKAGLASDFERAAKYYQAAAELRQPQAMFNLGLMHQHGVGLKQDFHLAKRYLDSAAETHVDAKWPVNLALIGLYIQWWFFGDRTDIPFLSTGTPAGVSGALIESTLITEAAKVIRQKWDKAKKKVDRWGLLDRGGEIDGQHHQEEQQQQEEGGRGGAAVGGLGNMVEKWGRKVMELGNMREHAPALDTLLILLLSTAFLYVMRVRAQQREEERLRRMRGEEGQSVQQQQQQQQGGGGGGGRGQQQQQWGDQVRELINGGGGEAAREG